MSDVIGWCSEGALVLKETLGGLGRKHLTALVDKGECRIMRRDRKRVLDKCLEKPVFNPVRLMQSLEVAVQPRWF